MATEEVKVVKPLGEKKDFKDEAPLFFWETADHVTRDRSVGWYFMLTLVAIVIAGVFYFQKNWSAMFFVLGATFLFFVVSQIKPRKISSAIYELGIITDGKVYNFDEMKNFWISQGEITRLNFQKNGRIAAIVSMPIEESDTEKIVEMLNGKLPQEETKGENLVDRVNRMMRL
jgi:hypothetical protein